MQREQDVIHKIQDGTIIEYRNKNIELKSSWKQDNGKKISFLSNKNMDSPSWLIVGIADEGQLLGKNEAWAKQTEEIISQHLNQYLDPIQAVKNLHCDEIDGNWVILVEVENPGTVVRWNHKAYKGAGTTLSEMNPEEIMELTVKLPGRTDFSAQLNVAEYDPELVKEFCTGVERNQSENFFQGISSLSTQAQLDSLSINGTNTAKILFSKSTKYRIVVYDKHEEPIFNDTGGGLFNLLDLSFLEVISQHLEMLNDKRIRLPKRGLKEGIANAVAHAAYFENNGDLIIEIHPDRILISNLALPESKYFANKWFSRSHSTVNAILMETLRIYGAVDELGRGKNLIYVDSIKNGYLPPEVILENNGRLDRWKLCIHLGHLDKKQTLLIDRLGSLYKNELMVQIANALILWRDKKVEEIKKYIDGESFPYFEKILKDFNGPVFYYEKDDRLILRRWARIIIVEGKSSKALSVAEEENILSMVYDISTKYNNGILTVKEFREFARMGNSASEITLSSNILKGWAEKGILEKIRKGTYKFIRTPEAETIEEQVEVLKKRLFEK